MQTEIYTGKRYYAMYDYLYEKYERYTDEVLIDNWYWHQHDSQGKNDYDWICVEVCQNILKQRGNTYLQDTYKIDQHEGVFDYEYSK